MIIPMKPEQVRQLAIRPKDRAIASAKRAGATFAGFAAFAVLTSTISSCCFEDEPNKGPKPGEIVVVNEPQGLPNRRSEPGSADMDSETRKSERKETAADAASPAPSSTKQKSQGPSDDSAIMKGDEWCGKGMARIARFCIDRWESELISISDKTVFPFYKEPPFDMSNLMAHTAPGIYPQGYVSQNVAGKACANAGKRLCTLYEWKEACSGDSKLRFPYGNAFTEGKCNVNKTDPHILDLFFWKTPHRKRGGNMFKDECLLKISLSLPKDDPCMVKIADSPNASWNEDHTLALRYWEKTGAYKDCMTEKGVYDLVGNASEWVSDTKMVGGDRKLHGVFAGEPVSSHYKDGCYHYTSAHWTDYPDYSLGIRCCRDVK